MEKNFGDHYFTRPLVLFRLMNAAQGRHILNRNQDCRLAHMILKVTSSVSSPHNHEYQSRHKAGYLNTMNVRLKSDKKG